MAQADGTIYIDTAIDAGGMKPGGREVEALAKRMAKTVSGIGDAAKIALQKQVNSFVKQNQAYAQQEQKVESLRAKIEKLNNQKVETKEYSSISKEIEKTEAALDRAIEKQIKFVETGGNRESRAFAAMEYDIENLNNLLDEANAKKRELENSGKAYQRVDTTGEEQKLAREAEKLRQMNASLQTSFDSLQQKVNSYNGSAKQLNLTKGRLTRTLKNMVGYVKRAAAAMLGLNKQTKSTRMSLGRMLGMSLLFSTVFRAISAATKAIKEGFTNLAQYSNETNRSISSLMSALTQLKNSLATAFSPILSVISPILTKFINLLSQAATYVGMFFAALTGKSTFTRAVAVQEDYAASLKDSASAAKDAEKATNKYLSGLDEVRRFETKEDTSSGGGAGGAGPGQMFEKVPISSKIQDMAKKFKDVLSQFFRPLKEAWDREGKFVMDSWKYALEETWKLMKDIGRDFLIMWNEEATIQMFADILHIIGDIGLVVGNLAHNLDEAWNKNQIGLRILENIRDIFAIIISHIRNAADYTVEWSENLDFYPLLESINTLLEALEPLADNVGAGLEWFWKNVLLPIAGWTIEEAVPTFLDMLAAAIDALNSVIDALKPLGQWLWDEFLEPLGKWAGETIIDAMETITDLLKKFSDWCNDNQGVVQNMAIIVGSFFAAFKIVETISGIYNLIVSMGGLIGIVKSMGGLITSVFNPWTLAIAAIIAAGVLLYKNWDTIKERAAKVWEAIKNTFSNAKENIGKIIDGIKENFQGWINFIVGIFTGDWQRAWDGITGIFRGVKNTIKGIIDTIIGFIEDLLGGIWDAINGIGRLESKINGVSNRSVSSIVDIGLKNTPFRASLMPPQVEPRVPYLASGAVIPPNAPFLAWMGDQKNGNNLEGPESLFRRIVREEAGGNKAGGTSVIKLFLDSKQVAEAVVRQGKIQQMASGRNMFELG